MEARLEGRDEHLRVLREAVAEALAGRGRLVVVSGEAGIGKSALAQAIASHAEGMGAEVTWGRAWEFADAPPYFPVRPCLRAIGVEPKQGGDAFQLWEEVVSSLARASAGSPRVWILEDLHAADLGTLDLLTFLAQPLRAIRALVVATVRANDPRLGERVMQRLARMARDGSEIHLGPLAEAEVAALAEATLGRAVPEAAVRRLVELTGGNPLFVVECARAFRAAGGVEGTLGSLPATVRQVVLERLEGLPTSTRDALACGAVLGREFSAASVARMTDSLPARVIDTLLPALRSGTIAELAPGRFVFSHGLVRDAIEDALPADRRAALHGRAEAALTALGDGPDVLVERARHALAALRGGDHEPALALVARASEMLERERAFDRAFELQMRLDDARRAGLGPRRARRSACVSRRSRARRAARRWRGARASRRSRRRARRATPRRSRTPSCCSPPTSGPASSTARSSRCSRRRSRCSETDRPRSGAASARGTRPRSSPPRIKRSRSGSRATRSRRPARSATRTRSATSSSRCRGACTTRLSRSASRS